MGKALGRAGEARGQADERTALTGAGLPLQGGAEDGLHAADVDQLEPEGARAGGVDARGPITVGEAQQLLGLT